MQLGIFIQVYLLQIDFCGCFLWFCWYDNNGLVQFGDKIIVMEDGGYIIIGRIELVLGEYYDILFIKFDEEVNEEWC